MLVLSRRAGERIQIGDSIEVTVVRIASGVVRIGIEAPAHMSVVRKEIEGKNQPYQRSTKQPRKQQSDLSVTQ
jgi:carbon storage regulator